MRMVCCIWAIVALWIGAAEAAFICAGHAPVASADPEGRAKAAVLAPRESAEKVHVLTLFAGFNDEVERNPDIPGYANRLFDADRVGSLSHFYATMSFGQFHLDGTVVPRRYPALQTASAYLTASPNGTGGYSHFVREVIRAADRDIDFGAYDNDGPDGIANSGDDDGVVDYLFVSVLSTPPGFIRGRATGIAGLGFRNMQTDDTGPNGKPIYIFGTPRWGSLVQEGLPSQSVGIMAHEFGHSLGLPDLYDVNYSEPGEDSAGIGHWGLMGWGAHGWTGDDGPVGFSPWSLEQLGWVGVDNERLVEVTGELTGVALLDLFQGGQIYKVYLPPQWIEGENGETGQYRFPQEYLLLEHRLRGRHNYQRAIPGEGLLVWHVYPGGDNGDEERKLVDLVCADGGYRDAGYPLGRIVEAVGGRDNLDFWAHDPAYVQAHGGNKGDATDPFDGIRYTTYDLSANPAPWNFGTEVSPLRIDVRRQGEALRLSIAPPRWSGVIRRQVSWSGEILVDGDLEIAHEGGLFIHRQTRVRMAAGDRRQGGLDPGRTEFTVRGDLQVEKMGHEARPVRFEGLQPGPSWYGIVLDPAQMGLVDVPERGLVWRGAVHGLVLPEASGGNQLLTVEGLRLSDAPIGLAAGDSDGRPNPGEVFRPVMEVTNRSLATLRNIEVRVEWDEPDAVAPTWAKSRLRWYQTGLSSVFDLSVPPGERRVLELPPLTLTQEARPGQWIHFTATLESGGQTWRRELEVQVGEPLVPLDLEPILEGVFVHGQRLLLSAQETVPVQVRVGTEAVAGVDLVVRDLTDGRLVQERSLQRSPLDPTLFQAQLRPGVLARMEWAFRVRLANGTALFAPQRLQVAVLVERWGDFLVLMDKDGIRKSLRELFDGVFAEKGWRGNFLEIGDLAGFEAAVLARYAKPGRAVVWLGGLMEKDMQALLSEYLEGESGLLVASLYFHWRMIPALRQQLPAERVLSAVPAPIEGAGLLKGIEFSSRHAYFSEPDPAAEVLLVDEDDRVTGLGLADGDSRLVYLPLELHDLPPDLRGRVLSRVLGFLVDRPVASGLGDVPVEEPPGSPVGLVIQGTGNTETVLGLAPWRPQVLVVNKGAAADFFTVRYQIVHQGQVLGQRQVEQAPMAPGEARQIILPGWSPPSAGEYEVQLSLAPIHRPVSARDTLQLRAIELSGGFTLNDQVVDDWANGAAFFDADNDGDLDLYLVRLLEENTFYRNRAGQLVLDRSGLEDGGRGRGIALGDYDGDGDLDLYLSNEGGNRFFDNDGGYFADATAGLDLRGSDLADAGRGRSAGFFDADNDGDLDLYLVNHGAPNRLFRNIGEGFIEAAASAGLADRGNGRGLALGDYDGDGDTDLFVANDSKSPSQLYRNDGGWFVGIGQAAGLKTAGAEVGGLFGDYDGDGDLDLFVSRQGGESELWRNESGRQFRLAVRPLGTWTVGAAFLDYDNDGDLDLATTALDHTRGGDQLYHNLGGRFAPVGALLGLRSHSAGRALSYGDYDGDGRQDLVVADQGGTALYDNATGGAHWLELDLGGRFFNPNGLGARVELAVAGQRQVREMHSSYGYGSQVQPRLHFGLGQNAVIDSLRVVWPDGVERTVRHVAVDHRLNLAYPRAKEAAASTELVGLELAANAPNPFNSQTQISFRLGRSGKALLAMYNIAGQRVRRLVDGDLAGGMHKVVWDGRDEKGREVASGVYIYRLEAVGKVLSRRLLLLK
ncbi:MAG: hypothetical protein GKR89_01685 [Candidatus Latescibacteria bacterium]|nr:hypothetical protein [Candidatus Latescibacterota bacterium]